VLVRRVSVSFMFALTGDIPMIYDRLQDAFLGKPPGASRVCKIVITGHRVAQKLDLPGQVRDLARDQPGSVHHGLYPGLGSR